MYFLNYYLVQIMQFKCYKAIVAPVLKMQLGIRYLIERVT